MQNILTIDNLVFGRKKTYMMNFKQGPGSKNAGILFRLWP